MSRFFVSKTMKMYKTEMNVERPLVTLALEKMSLLLQSAVVSVGRVAGSESVLARWCWDVCVSRWCMAKALLGEALVLWSLMSGGGVWGRVLVMVCGVVLCWDPVVELCEKLKEVESKNDGSYED